MATVNEIFDEINKKLGDDYGFPSHFAEIDVGDYEITDAKEYDDGFFIVYHTTDPNVVFSYNETKSILGRYIRDNNIVHIMLWRFNDVYVNDLPLDEANIFDM